VDAETQGLLDALVEGLPTARILLLVNYRPEYGHGWGGKTYYSQLRLDPLPPESAEELLHSLLGEDDDLEPLKRLLVKRTEGVPFFLEESVRTLVETGALAGERGGYRLGRPFDTIQVPATVQAILAARIDRLPPEDKTLLQTAAVIGKDVPFAILEAISDTSEETLRHGLGRLLASEFLYETALFPELEYTFKHALTQEVAYGGLLQERRRDLHARIVRAFESLYPGRSVGTLLSGSSPTSGSVRPTTRSASIREPWTTFERTSSSSSATCCRTVTTTCPRCPPSSPGSGWRCA